MKMLFFGLVLWTSTGTLLAQNKQLDSLAYSHWNSLNTNVLLSDDGKHVVYAIGNKSSKNIKIVIQFTSGKIIKEFFGELRDQQLAGNNNLVFIKGKDSLVIFSFNTNKIRCIPGVSYFSLNYYKNDPWICYTNISRQLTICNLESGQKKIFEDVERGEFSKGGNYLLFWKSDNNQGLSLNLVSMFSGDVVHTFEGNGITDLLIDDNHNQMVYKTGDTVWYYKVGSLSPVCVFIFASTDQGYLSSLNRFSKDGKQVFASIEKDETLNPVAKDVEIWAYTDFILPPRRQIVAKSRLSFLASISIENQTMAMLDQTGNIFFPSAKDASDSLALICNTSPGEEWSTSYKITWNLISTNNGRKKILEFLDNKLNVRVSPYGRFLTYFDSDKQNYYSYEIKTGALHNLTEGLQVSWFDQHRDDRSKTPRELNVRSVWGKYDQFLLIHDRFDIWKIDPLNMRSPVNITNGYGKKHSIVFNLSLAEYNEKGIIENEKIYLCAFNSGNKNNGFFEKFLNESGDPKPLFMGEYIFCSHSRYVLPSADFIPLKAKKEECYIARRMSAVEAPNYYSTCDFKTFIKLTDIRPQQDYNWYTTELHTWQSLNGSRLQGVLYKPKNFDPGKKYPIIFNYYERKSDRLNLFFKPEVLCDGCVIDIPTYVSQGYLVFTPDIHYEIGDPMKGTFNSIVSAANYIRNLPFIDNQKMGLMGCSFGGLQTNYLITHTNLFAAAVAASSIADLVSAYGGIIEGGTSSQDYFENGGQARMGGSLWERPAAYISNSPLFDAHNITTPLLMMHTKKDGVYPFSNAIEFFTGLRRLGKKVWMLVYSQGNHGVQGKEAEDFAMRMNQFFDFYLKDNRAPVWLIEGGASQNSRGRSNMQLDSIGRVPGPGLLKAEEVQKVNSWMTRDPVSVTLK